MTNLALDLNVLILKEGSSSLNDMSRHGLGWRDGVE